MGDIPEEQELDPSWVCCLFEDIPATYCDALSLDYMIARPSPNSHTFSKSTKDSYETLDDPDGCCRKRVRGVSFCGSSSRACREKLRRDRLNERFLELNTILEHGNTLKLDKAATLSKAVQMVKMLQHETTTLKSQNVKLKQNISALKAEKKELRCEKQRLTAEKDKIEQRIKALGVPHDMQFRSSLNQAPTQPVAGKLMPVFKYPGVPLWHFVPYAYVDTSRDHVLRPPVA